MKGRRWLAPLVAGLALGACGEEGPTAIGGALVPTDIETFEIVLPAARLLELDTTVRGLTRPVEAGFTLIARDFEGEFDAHTLLSFAPPPPTVIWQDEEGAVHTEEDPVYVAGVIRLLVDTVWTALEPGVEFEVRPLTEDWEPVSATWERRVDTDVEREPWIQPGGTTGEQVNRAALAEEADTVFVNVDSATVAHWLSVGGAARGARVSLVTAGERVAISNAGLTLQARPEARPDTLVDAGVSVDAATFVYTPAQPPPAPGELRVAGLPNWRAMLRLRPRLDTLLVPCPGGGGTVIEDCARLGELHVTKAALLLTPLDVPPYFVPLSTIELEARGALDAPGVPPGRAPLGGRVNALNVMVGAELFRDPEPEAVSLELTELVALLSRVPAEVPQETRPPSLLALLSTPEHGMFGFGSFGGIAAGDRQLRVRLVLTRGEAVGIR